MSDPFLAEVRIFPFNFAPRGWAMCNGQLIPIQQNATLFAVIGSIYGGNAVTNFALPDFEGNLPVCAGTGPGGLAQYDPGQFGGGQTFTLTRAENPSHSHAVAASDQNGTSSDPTGNVYAKGQWLVDNNNKGAIQMYDTDAPAITLDPSALGPAGGGQPHNNMMPSLTLNFCIALVGIFPQRT